MYFVLPLTTNLLPYEYTKIEKYDVDTLCRSHHNVSLQ